MKAFVVEDGVAVPFDQADVDTDQILPARFLRRPRQGGYGQFLFRDVRFNDDDSERPDFILNQAPYRSASIMVADRNFGCGSSREHAVWGLRELGIRAILGTSFGGIFSDNCLRNGVPALTLPAPHIERLGALVQDPNRCELRVDLGTQTVASMGDGQVVTIQLDPWQRDMLLQGLDPVGMTLTRAQDIRDFEARYYSTNPHPEMGP